MSERKKINTIIRDYFQDVHVFNTLKKKNYLIWLKMHLNFVT
jgi:hypothetical protein